jgi:hypothetical protein
MVELDGEKLVSVAIDEEEMGKVKSRIADKLAKLRRGEHL